MWHNSKLFCWIFLVLFQNGLIYTEIHEKKLKSLKGLKSEDEEHEEDRNKRGDEGGNEGGDVGEGGGHGQCGHEYCAEGGDKGE